MVKEFINLIFFVFSLFYIKYSLAFVVQDASKAMSFNNVSRSVATTPSKNSTAELFYDDSIDYDEIGDKLLNKKQQKIYVDLSLSTTKNIRMPVGQTIFITLSEEDNCFWHIDSNEKIIIPSSTNKENNIRIIEFKAANKGDATIFLDNICKEGNSSKVIQSRIIRIKVN